MSIFKDCNVNYSYRIQDSLRFNRIYDEEYVFHQVIDNKTTCYERKSYQQYTEK